MVLTWWRSLICLWEMTSGATTCSGSFHKTARRLSLCLPLRQLTQFNNELIPDSEYLTGKTLARKTVGFVIL